MINKINKLSQSEFIKVFANIFENAVWIAEDLYKQKPFRDFQELTSKMLEIFDKTTKKKQIKILNSHPDLADRTKIKDLTIDSKKEQSSARLDQCNEEEFKEFKKLNRIYKKKFNFPFILAVKGKNKIQIIENFRKRISSNVEKEFDEAINQVKIIATMRLKDVENKIF